MGKKEEGLNQMEKRLLTLVHNVPGDSEASSVMTGKSATFKVPTFDGSGAWELYHKQFEATAAHNQWNDVKKDVALTVHLKGPALQVLAALPHSDTIEYASLVNRLEQRFGQKHLAPVKRRVLMNRIQKSGEVLQDYAADIRRTPHPRGIPNLGPRICGVLW